MKAFRLCLVISVVSLAGCATGNSLTTWLFGQPESYYTDPASPGYQEFHYPGLCGDCGRVLYFSKAQWDAQAPVTCPYDGSIQNLQYASNRYTYEANRAQQQANAQLGQQFLTAWQQQQAASAQKQAAFQQCMARCKMTQNMMGYDAVSRSLECFNSCRTW